MLAAFRCTLTFSVVGLGASASTVSGLDSSFGGGGEAVVQPNPACARGCVEFFGSHAESLAVAPNGSIVLAGNGAGAGPGAGLSWLARLSPSGALDTSFGDGGYAEGVAGLRMSRVTVAKDGAALALVSREGGGLGVERFTATGALDSSFGAGGVRWLAGLKEPVEGVFDARGRIVVLGWASVRGGVTVARYLASGAPDGTFGRRGVARVGVLGEAQPVKLAVEPGGAVVLAGSDASGGGSNALELARLTSAGKPDRGFGKRGVVKVSRAFAGIDALAVGPGHTILLADGKLLSTAGKRETKLIVGRYTSRGIDTSFGVHGIAVTTFPAGRAGLGLTPTAIAFLSTTAVVVGEQRERSVDVARGTWFLAAYTPGGRDCSFGNRGFVEGSEGGANAVTAQGDQRIVIAGWAPGHQPDGAGMAFMAARYVVAGKPETCGRYSSSGVMTKPSRSVPRLSRASTVSRRQLRICASATYSGRRSLPSPARRRGAMRALGCGDRPPERLAPRRAPCALRRLAVQSGLRATGARARPTSSRTT